MRARTQGEGAERQVREREKKEGSRERETEKARCGETTAEH